MTERQDDCIHERRQEKWMMQEFRDTVFIVGGGETGGDWQIRPDLPGYQRSSAIYTLPACTGEEEMVLSLSS